MYRQALHTLVHSRVQFQHNQVYANSKMTCAVPGPIKYANLEMTYGASAVIAVNAAMLYVVDVVKGYHNH